MKKVIAIAAAFFMLAAFCSCSEETDDNIAAEVISQEEAETAVQRVSGTIFAVTGDSEEDIIQTEITCDGGEITPARIAAGLSGWTGLKFRITATVDEEGKKISVDWLAEASVFEESVPDTQREAFSFSDVSSLRVFMLNSLGRSISENYKGYDVFFTAAGEDIGTLVDGFSSDTPFSSTES